MKNILQIKNSGTTLLLLLTRRIWNSIILVVKWLRKQTNLQILLTGYEEHFEISKMTQIGDNVPNMIP